MPFGETPAFDRGIDRGVMMPVGELITSAISNKGNPTGILQDNTFRVQNAQEVRLVDNKGKVLFSGIGPDAARQAVALGQSISDEKGNKAGWTIQTGDRYLNTDGTVGGTRWSDVANEKVNKSVLGKIADVALPVVGGILAGPLGAAAGSAASSVAQGRSLEGTLLRAALAGGTSALMPGAPPAGSDAAVNAAADAALQNAVNAGAQAGSQALGSVYGSTLGSALGSAATSAVAPAVGDIVVTAARNAAPTSLFPAVTGGISNTLLDRVITPPAQVQQPPAEQPLEAGPEIVATAQTGAQIPVVPPPIPDVGSLEKFTPIEEILKDVAMTPEKQSLLDRLTANMSLVDYLQLAGIAGSAGASLLGGGGGGTGTAVPYVSPFGPGVGMGGLPAGQDRRVDPNIADYEKYGFGPEALFFAAQPGPVLAPTTPGPASAMVNPQYVPLI